ncbi:ATP-, maltotriose-and DNA-dependent transcriptional regulator MalT [Lentzea xinjiangensis]|uniref:ATP-, maltotriose-and DNA-dependent transcriptional regulator MalT n=1 Tax=Lentzea xinjiangensis TaxID=402600 RepID=A0A1H9J016_9PSEU|nr:BTAD domain-containing putative transcriptional regulator [Lentzea xinjiangensis]SEQ79955.1 ATP-, maltotriose-and DNA-dependent transcriptional regulator MalT [Lentzea xinjiangensis]
MLQPALPARLVDRPALSSALDAASAHEVVVVKAGPGWGKTTSVAAWAAARRACWLDAAAGTSLERLSRGLLRALRHRLPRLPADLVTTTAQSADTVAGLIRGLLDVHLDEPVVLVVDNAGALAPGSGEARFVEALCLRRPALLRLVLLTRGEPVFALPAAEEITSRQLAFTEPEVAALVGAEAAGTVLARTGGRPAAVALYREALSGGCALPDESGDVVAQLASSVLAGEPEQTRELVRTIALLGRVSTALCVALGFADAREVLPRLARRGLLSGPEWTVVEPVGELLRRDADDGEIRLKAAVFCERTGAHAEALRHLVAAGRADLVAQLLLRRDEQIVAGGDADAVLAAVDRLEVDDPRLHLVSGFARQHRGDWLGALHCYEQAAGELKPCRSWRMGQLHALAGQTARAVDLVERTVFDEVASVDEVRLLSLAVGWFREVGRHERARELADRCALTARRRGGHAAFAWSSRAFGLLAGYDGDRAAFESHYGQAVERSRRAGNRVLELMIRTERAWFRTETGPADALAEIDEVVVIGRQAGLTGHEPGCRSIRALANARLGRFDAALADATFTDASLSGAAASSRALLIRAEVHRRRGEPGQAQAFLDEALAMPGAGPLAKATLARVVAGEDLAAARRLAEEAVAESRVLRSQEVPALLARGWVAALAGDRETARADAATARAVAGRRGDKAGLADALQLAAVTSADREALLAEAATVWRAAGDPVGAAAAELAAARLSGVDVTRFEDELHGHGVRTDVRMADVLGIGLPRAARIVVRTLGRFQVLRDGAAVPAASWQSKKARDLLKILTAHRGRPVPRPQLVELLWPDDASDRTANRLSVLLSTLRAVLSVPGLPAGAEPLVADRDTVSLDLSFVDLDVAGFLGAASAALAAHRRGEPSALSLLTDADELYLGEFLAEEPYEPWAIQAREEVRGRYTAVLRALVQLVRDPDQQVGYLVRMLELDPYDEGAHVRLVKALRAAGRHGEARRRYRVYLEQMAEIGVRPAEPDLFHPSVVLKAG